MLDWEVAFEIMLIENKDLTEHILRGLFDIGGISIGLGTYRGMYGKFEVAEWKSE
jgi:hypothetical protein